MLPGAGILLSERVYLIVKITELLSETTSKYATNNDGKIWFKIYHGRDDGVILEHNGSPTVVATPTLNPVDIKFEGLNSTTYNIILTELSKGTRHTFVVTIGYGSGESVVYNGTTYGKNSEIIISLE